MIPRELFRKETINTLRSFGEFVLANEKRITPRVFADEFWKLEKQYARGGNIDTFCRESDNLAQMLFNHYKDDYVGIIMSVLCKTNEARPQALEYFAWKGFDIARMNRDFVHMMARLNDLRNVYIENPACFRQYMDVLFRQEHCLHKLTSYYDDVSKNYHSVSREIAPRGTYEEMLAYTQTEIGRITKYSNPKDARYKLSSAHNIFLKRGKHKHAEYVRKLLRDIDRNSFRRRFE